MNILNGNTLDDTIENHGETAVSNDVINNGPVNDTLISGTADNDTILNQQGTNVTIDASDGNDVITDSGNNTVIDAGNGDDLITIVVPSIATAASAHTITAGEGNDTISFNFLDPSVYPTSEILITDLTENDALRFDKVIDTFSERYVDDNLILTDDAGSLSITLTGMTNTDGIKNVSVYNNANQAVSLSSLLTNPVDIKTQQDVVQDFILSLKETSKTGTTAIDEAIIFASSGRYTSYSDLITDFVEESKKFTSAITFLKDRCGIVLDNNDIGAITGYDVGASTVEISAENIVPESGALVSLESGFAGGSFPADVTVNSANALSFTKRGLKVTVDDFGTIVTDAASDDATVSAEAELKLSIINGLYTWWIENSLQLIDSSFAINFESENVTADEMTVNFYSDSKASDYVYYEETGSDSSGNVLGLTLNINLAKLTNLNPAQNSNGLISTGTPYFDRMVASALTSAVMAANIIRLNSNTVSIWDVIVRGMSELTQGGDDTRNDTVKSLIASIRDEDTDEIVGAVTNDTRDSNGSVLQNLLADITDVENVFGYALFRYFAKQVSDSSELPYAVKYSGDKSSLQFTSLYTSPIFDLKNYDATIAAVDTSELLDSVKIIGNAANNTISAMPYGGTISGGAGDDVLYGGNSTNTFLYASGDGNDTIFSFFANDTLHITSGTINTIYGSEDGQSNVIISVGDNEIVLDDAAGRTVNIIDPNGALISTIYGSSSDTLDCVNGYYTYKGGNKFITNYTPGEIIRVSTDFGGIRLGASDVSVLSSSGALKISNAKDKVIEGCDSDGNNTVLVYAANVSGNIDLSTRTGFEIIAGRATDSDIIIAGGGGSSISGIGGNDTLQGGTGVDHFVYFGDNNVIKNFGTGDILELNAGIPSYAFDGASVTLNSANGDIILQDILGKRIEIDDFGGNVIVRAYFANAAGTIDGTIYNEKEVISGAAYAADSIQIGDGGGSLWGGAGNVSDTLSGGAGVDVFGFGQNDGDDVFLNASQNDFIYMYDFTLEDVNNPVPAFDNNNTLTIKFGSGQIMQVGNSDSVSPTFMLADGTNWQYGNGAWTRVSL